MAAGNPPHDPAPFFGEETPAPAGSYAVWAQASDGVRLRLGQLGTGARGTVLCFQGRTEYLEKYGHVAERMAAAGFGVVAVDWRGQGLSERLLTEAWLGHVERFADYQRDVAALVAFASARNMPRPWFLLAHSMGGAIGLRALQAGLPVQAAAFSAPMWDLTMLPVLRPVSRVVPWLADKLGQERRIVPGTALRPYVLDADPDDNVLTTDRDMFLWFQNHVKAHPGLGLGGPTLRWLNESIREFDAYRRAPAPPLPCRVYLGGRERIVSPARIRELAHAWSTASLVELPGGEHEVLMEGPETRNRVIDDAIAFFAAAPSS